MLQTQHPCRTLARIISPKAEVNGPTILLSQHLPHGMPVVSLHTSVHKLQDQKSEWVNDTDTLHQQGIQPPA